MTHATSQKIHLGESRFSGSAEVMLESVEFEALNDQIESTKKYILAIKIEIFMMEYNPLCILLGKFLPKDGAFRLEKN